MMEEKRTGTMNNRMRAAWSHSKNEWARIMEPSVKIERKRVKSETKRKRGRRGIDELSLKEQNESAKKRTRTHLQTTVLDNVSLDVDLVPVDDLVDDVVFDDDDDDVGVDTMISF